MGFLSDISDRVFSAEWKKRIFCDCQGTLLGECFDGGFNDELFDFLKLAHDRGYEITIFSTKPFMVEDPIEDYLEERFGNRLIFGEVRHKKDYSILMRGFIAFDDDHASHGMRIKHELEPNDPAIKRMTMQLESGRALDQVSITP